MVKGLNNDMKILQKICFVLLLTTFSSAYAGDCFEDRDVDDCRVKAEQGDARAQSNLGVCMPMDKVFFRIIKKQSSGIERQQNKDML